MGTDPQEGVDPAIAELIRCKVKKMFGKHRGYNQQDREDAAQESWLSITVGMRRFDPDRASKRTFASRIVGNTLNTLLEHDDAQKRHRRRIAGAPTENLPDHRRQHQIDTQLDVAETISQLPAQWVPIATLFINHSQAEVMKLTNLSRHRVRALRRRIAEHFRAQALDPEISQPATKSRGKSVHNK